LGINVLPPSINQSGFYFKVEDNHSIRFGLGGIKNVGEDIVKAVVDERKERGRF
jgi:DNA polymerase-3 subunit alpha